MQRRKTETPSFDILPILYAHGMVQEPVGRRVHCPYHLDNRPSAVINEEHTLFFCHVCGIGGDAIALIRERNGLSYQAALDEASELSESVHQPVRRKTGRRRGLFG